MEKNGQVTLGELRDAMQNARSSANQAEEKAKREKRELKNKMSQLFLESLISAVEIYGTDLEGCRIYVKQTKSGIQMIAKKSLFAPVIHLRTWLRPYKVGSAELSEDEFYLALRGALKCFDVDSFNNWHPKLDDYFVVKKWRSIILRF